MSRFNSSADTLGSRYLVQNELVKQAKLRVKDVEGRMGTWASSPKMEQDIRDAIDRKTSKSFVLRHPILTGIPTLGIAPAIARYNALRDITSQLARKHPEIRKAIVRKRQAELEEARVVAEQKIARTRASQPAQVAAIAAAAFRR